MRIRYRKPQPEPQPDPIGNLCLLLIYLLLAFGAVVAHAARSGDW